MLGTHPIGKDGAGGVMQPRWQRALRTHRQAHPEWADRDHGHLMFAACSESVASLALIAAFPTAYVLQTLGGVPSAMDAATEATFEVGVATQGIREIVVCGHDLCSAHGGARTREESQSLLVERCRALHTNDPIGSILRRARVKMRALWIEDKSGELYTCSFEGHPARRLVDEDLATMFAAFDQVCP